MTKPFARVNLCERLRREARVRRERMHAHAARCIERQHDTIVNLKLRERSNTKQFAYDALRLAHHVLSQNEEYLMVGCPPEDPMLVAAARRVVDLKGPAPSALSRTRKR
jgi:hypothetical protein